jgi:hypothetical protein
MHVAAVLGLPVGRLTDLRLAVNEACALLLRSGAAETQAGDEAAPRAGGDGGVGVGGETGTMLELRFERCPGELRVLVSGPAPRHGSNPDEIGWILLRALVGDVRMDVLGGTATVTLTEPLPAAW